ncbi:hypothetical protein ACE6H2_011487 [Prunus campanulata]
MKQFMEARKPVASICHGLEILVAAGVLQIKACVVSSGGMFVEADPIDRCVTDGNLVTAAAWHGQPELISQLMTLLDIRVSLWSPFTRSAASK